jgi:glutamate 5-kinase
MRTQLTPKDIIDNSKRIVIKIGTNSIVDTNRWEEKTEWLFNTASQIVAIRDAARCLGIKREFIIVASGAIGMERVARNGLKPSTPEDRQKFASLGQIKLTDFYTRSFAPFQTEVGQILLTPDNLENPFELKLALKLCDSLLGEGSIPVINANDAVSNSETLKDNDTLSAQVAVAVDADLLINITDVDGFYDSDPHKNAHAKRIPEIELLNGKLLSSAGASRGDHSVGGMETKGDAALIATAKHCSMIILNGERTGSLARLFNGHYSHATFIPYTAHPQLNMF